MRIGVRTFLTDRSILPDELGSAVEAAGFSTLWVPEHTHMPIAHSPLPRGNRLPDAYRRTLDPFVALTSVAAATSTLRLGTGVCLVAQRDALLFAKETATLDYLSRGRLEVGVGYGWNVAEGEHHGLVWHERRTVVREKLDGVRRLWTQEVASMEGQYVRFGETWSWPKPVQTPGPPVLIASALGSRTLADIIAVGDGWMPVSDDIRHGDIYRLRSAWRASERDNAPLIHVFVKRFDPSELEVYARAEVDVVSLPLPSGGRDVVLPILEEYRKSMKMYT